MKISGKKPLAIAAMMIGMCGFAVSGNLSDTMGDMFMSTSTSPQPYSSNTRNGYYGGAFSLRVPVKNYTLMTYDAPKISAGCSGISLSAGSFSIMNDEEFKQMIRQIGSAAGMYFFKLALDQISPNIMRTLNGLEEFMSKFTLNNINTCKIGSSIATGAMGQFPVKKAGEYSKKFAEDLNVAKGQVPDPIAAMKKSFSEGVDGAGGEEALPMGNTVWRALHMKDAADVIGANNITRDKYKMMEYLMSMVGTTIIAIDGENSSGGTVTCSGANMCDTDIPDYNARLTLFDLLNGATGPEVKYLTCGGDNEEMGCKNPQPVDFGFEGARKYVHTILYGSASATDPEEDSLIENISSGDELTPEQTSFLNTLPPEFMMSWIPVQKSKQGSEMVIRAYEEFMALEFTRLMGTSMIQALLKGWDGKSGEKIKIPLEGRQLEQIDLRNEELHEITKMMLAALKPTIAVVNEASEIAKKHPRMYFSLSGN